MPQEDHSNKARCSLGFKSDSMRYDKIYDDPQGTETFSLTAFTAAGLGFVTCLSLASWVTVFADVDGIDAGGMPCGFCKVITSSLKVVSERKANNVLVCALFELDVV